jgi:hypothetical protein
MSTEAVIQPTPTSPRVKARIAGLFYLLVFVTGTLALVSVRGRIAGNLISTGLYVVVILLFYDLFKPVDRRVSMVAAVVGLVGCVFGALASFRVVPFGINALAVFGVYCLLIGWLIFRSTFLPRALGVLMAIGGLGWLTFASPALAKDLPPWNMAPGIIGEGALTLWLLAKGVDPDRWREQESAARVREAK